MNSELGNGQHSKGVEEEDVDIGGDDEETVVIEDTVVIDTEDDPTVGDLSVEINVEELVAKIESDEGEESDKKREVKKRLDEIIEERNDELDSTYNFNLDDDDL